jgi:hypothetical protein
MTSAVLAAQSPWFDLLSNMKALIAEIVGSNPA